MAEHMVRNTANDRQVGGNHYQGHSKQHWDLVDEYGWDYFQAMIIKYVMRWKLKGNGIQDLEKAQHFIQKYLELQRKKSIPSPQLSPLGQEISDQIQVQEKRKNIYEK